MTKLVFSLALLTVALALGGCATLGSTVRAGRPGARRPRGSVGVSQLSDAHRDRADRI
jgi:hypothetical protein